MRWEVSCIKSNGTRRAQFIQWSVPKNIRDNLQLKDGDECSIKVSLEKFDHINTYRLTSGGEFRVSNDVAKFISKGDNVFFELTDVLGKIANDFEQRVRESSALKANDRQKRLSLAKPNPESYQTQVTLFRRNPDVVAEVLIQANGVCQQCKQAAPFNRTKDNSPYLEVHHKKQLSEGGEDSVKNAIAFCPNCHRKNHYG